jgi:phospholipid/cholesterol/gamma-HCH transport system ATP-binding protein
LPPLIEIKGLFYETEGGISLFEDVNLEFWGGEKVAFIGPLSSGKIELLRILSGIARPKKGDVCLFGQAIGEISRRELDKLRERIGFIFLNPTLISNLKVIENVALPILYHTSDSNDEVIKKARLLLEDVNYMGDVWSLPGILPFFARKIVAFARAMSLNPDIVMCDRYLVGLDSEQRQHMLDLLNGFHQKKDGRLTLITSDDEKEIKSLELDRVFKIEGKTLKRISD